jgi:hypothetical protein
MVNSSVVKVDICVNKCIMYIGTYEAQISCPVCCESRFYPCSQCSQETSNDAEKCNPFLGKDRSMHKRGRVPLASIETDEFYYYEIKTLMEGLLPDSTSDVFDFDKVPHAKFQQYWSKRGLLV